MPLLPFSALYWFGWRCYEAIYALGIKRPQEPHPCVMVVGNLRTGGSGKTPTIIAVATLLQEMGQSVVVSASGYGSQRAQAASVAPDGPLIAAEWGDEPTEIRDALPQIPLIVGRRRVLAAQLCQQHFPGSILLLDDGLQHKPLKHHIALLLDPEITPNPFVLPAGPYREPRSNRNRFETILPRDFPLAAEFRLESPESERVELNPGQQVQFLTAIAQPERFEYAIELAGLRTVHGSFLPDHHPLDTPGLLNGFDPKLPILVTGKDWVKLRARPDAINWNFLILRQTYRFETETQFRTWLAQKLHHVQTKTT